MGCKAWGAPAVDLESTPCVGVSIRSPALSAVCSLGSVGVEWGGGRELVAVP